MVMVEHILVFGGNTLYLFRRSHIHQLHTLRTIHCLIEHYHFEQRRN
jgi:hypothetical protein